MATQHSESGGSLSLLPSRLGLPRGRAALPEAEVALSQRGRILQAVTDEVAERGYPATTVAHVIARARVSRSAFYAQFTDKEDAFAHAHLAASEQLFALISDAIAARAGAGWRARHRAGIAAYLHGFQTAPSYATSFMVEIRAAGRRLLDQRDRVLERHARGIRGFAREIHRARPDRPKPSWEAIVGAVGGSDELATRAIRSRRLDELPRLLDPILELQCAVIDPASSQD